MPQTSDHPYASFLRQVQKPSRYLGGEHGEIRKDWAAASCRMCLAFPDVYEVGMSHLGYKILYSLVNGESDLLAERAYAPWVDMEAALRERSEPLRSLETTRPLSDFDVVGFSLQFELTFTNILTMLELGGIPLRANERDEEAPLIVAGGPNATHPEPMAPFMDAFLVGDGETAIRELMRCWAQGRDAGVTRHQRLQALSALPGIYVPALYEVERQPDNGHQVVVRAGSGLDPQPPLPVQRSFVDRLGDFPFPKAGPIASTETVFDRVSVELARGCTEGCRFCQAGMIYRPVREREPDEVLGVIKHAIRDGGYDSASLTSLSTADYSAISPLIHKVTDELAEQRASISVSSLRAYGLEEDVLDRLAESGTKGLTFAPEAGTQRMRDVINKNVTEEQLLETARRIFSRGWSKMKLYFMIGLPTEEDEDVLGIVRTGARALEVGRRLGGRSARVVVNVSTFVPKPHTPFQWAAMNSHDEIVRKQRLLRDEARRLGVTLRLHDSRGSWIEGVLARGDRRLGDAIETAYRKGARFDSWEEQLNVDAWNEAFAEHDVKAEQYLGTLPMDAPLPWSHLDVGLADGFLAKEYRKSLRDRLSPPCGKAVGHFVHHNNLDSHEADPKKLVCYNCGVACDMQAMRDTRAEYLVQLGAHQARPPAPPPEPKPKLKGRRKPPARPDQGQPIRLRLRYSKLGRAAFGSHLDMVRLLPRLFRRLELPLYYSRGFHPKPQMSFGPALSLGIAGLSEYVEVKLSQQRPVDPAELAAQLSEASIDGLNFLEARLISPGEEKLNNLIHEASYVAALPAAWLKEVGLSDPQVLAARIAERRQLTLEVRRVIEGIGKRVRVSDYLLDAEVGAGTEVLAAAGLAGNLLPVRVRLAITPQGTAKASEALQALLDLPDVPARWVRAGLFWRRDGASGTPMDPPAAVNVPVADSELGAA